MIPLKLLLLFQSAILTSSMFVIYSTHKYSTDGKTFKKVDCDTLSLMMKGNLKSIELLGSYKKNNTFSKLFGISGGFLIGWPIGGYIGSGGNWKDSYTTMLGIGVALTAVGIIFETTASNRLKESVDNFNKESLSTLSKLKLNLGYQEYDKTFSINLKSNF